MPLLAVIAFGFITWFYYYFFIHVPFVKKRDKTLSEGDKQELDDFSKKVAEKRAAAKLPSEVDDRK